MCKTGMWEGTAAEETENTKAPESTAHPGISQPSTPARGADADKKRDARRLSLE